MHIYHIYIYIIFRTHLGGILIFKLHNSIPGVKYIPGELDQYHGYWYFSTQTSRTICKMNWSLCSNYLNYLCCLIINKWKCIFVFPQTVQLHDDVIKWKHFPRDRWITLTKANDAELWCLLWFAPEIPVKQTIGTPLIWDAGIFTMTSV